jgi:hypothetical protein
MNAFNTSTALSLVYCGVALIGLILIGGAILSLLRSFTPGQQSRPRSTSSPPAPGKAHRATSYSLGLGAAVFGLTGLLANLVLHLQPATGVIVSLAMGLIVGFIALTLLVDRRAPGIEDSAILGFDPAGLRAEVVIAIPPGGLGEIALQHGASRVNLGARSATGRSIATGTPVVIERISNHVAIVSPLD